MVCCLICWSPGCNADGTLDDFPFYPPPKLSTSSFSTAIAIGSSSLMIQLSGSSWASVGSATTFFGSGQVGSRRPRFFLSHHRRELSIKRSSWPLRPHHSHCNRRGHYNRIIRESSIWRSSIESPQPESRSSKGINRELPLKSRIVSYQLPSHQPRDTLARIILSIKHHHQQPHRRQPQTLAGSTPWMIQLLRWVMRRGSGYCIRGAPGTDFTPKGNIISGYVRTSWPTPIINRFSKPPRAWRLHNDLSCHSCNT